MAREYCFVDPEKAKDFVGEPLSENVNTAYNNLIRMVVPPEAAQRAFTIFARNIAYHKEKQAQET